MNKILNDVKSLEDGRFGLSFLNSSIDFYSLLLLYFNSEEDFDTCQWNVDILVQDFLK